MSGRRKSLGGTSFIEAGQGEPLVLLHDNGETADAFSALIEALAPAQWIIAPDIEPDADFQPVRRLLDDLGISSANVLGRGAGAQLGLELAAVPFKKGGVLAAMEHLVAEARKAQGNRRAA